MIDISPTLDHDVGLASIENAVATLKDELRLVSNPPRVFFVVFTGEHRLFEREAERAQARGYDAIFFQPGPLLPTSFAWDIVMYSCADAEPIARIRHRPAI